MRTDPNGGFYDDDDDRPENDVPPDDPAEKFAAWEAIHNDPDYDPEIHSEPGFPDYPEEEK
jgi:hypothetical protein